MTMDTPPPAGEPDDSTSAGTIGDSGYTLEDLSDYSDRGREPAIPAIDDNAECQSVLASIERVGALSRDLVAKEATDHPALDESWFGSLFAAISSEAKAGRDIPLSSPDPRTRLSITEGAVRELVRAAGDGVDGALVGRCQLHGDLDGAGSGIRVELSISVLLGAPVHEVAALVRQRVYSELLAHTELAVEAVDVTVADVHVIPNPQGGTE